MTASSEWDALVTSLGGHPLQLWGWGQAKAHGGAWDPVRLRVDGPDGPIGAAQVLVRHVPRPFRAMCHLPRGPVVADGVDPSVVIAAVVEHCRSQIGGVGITIEPHLRAGTPLDVPGARPSKHPILFPDTLILDLTRSEDELMSDMNKTTRKGVRRGQRADLTYRRVETIEELRACLAVYRETARRAGFGLHTDDYFEGVWRELGEASPVFAAFSGDAPVSFLWPVASATTSFELYGGADEVGLATHANFAVKWLAITAMKERGLREYDLNGLLNDGISWFKRGFSDHEDHLVPSFDVPFSPWYPVWTTALPMAKKVVRRLSRR